MIARLCVNFQEPGNTNIHNVLMFWLNLFGVIFSAADRASVAYQSEYDTAKDEIMAVLNNKIRVETIAKVKNIPNLFYRVIKGEKVLTKAPFIYGFISVLQAPCEANYVLMTLECYKLFSENKEFYNRTKYIDTIREGMKNGNVRKIYDTAMENIETWKEIGEPKWLEDWIQDRKPDWELALDLLAFYYE